MKKLFLSFVFLLVLSSICFTVAFAEQLTDGEHTVPVSVVGDSCVDLDGATVNPWAEDAYLRYSVTGGKIQGQCYLGNRYYEIGYWPLGLGVGSSDTAKVKEYSTIAGKGSFKYNDEGYKGMEVVLPSAVTNINEVIHISDIDTSEIANPTAVPTEFPTVIKNISSADYAAKWDYAKSVFNTANAASITKIILTEGVTNVDAAAFAYIPSTTLTIKYPSTIASIGGHVYRYCENLTKFTIEGFYVPTFTGGVYTFSNCPKLEEIIIDVKGLGFVQSGAINAPNLKKLTIKTNNTGISNVGNLELGNLEKSSFVNTTVEEITIDTCGNSINRLCAKAFENLTNLRVLNLSCKQINHINDGVFSGNLTNTRVNYPANIGKPELMKAFPEQWRLCPYGADYVTIFELTDGDESNTYNIEYYSANAEDTVSSKIILAMYNGSGDLIMVKSATADLVKDSVILTSAPAYAKLIMVDSLTSLKPLSVNAELEYTPAQ